MKFYLLSIFLLKICRTQVICTFDELKAELLNDINTDNDGKLDCLREYK